MPSDYIAQSHFPTPAVYLPMQSYFCVIPESIHTNLSSGPPVIISEATNQLIYLQPSPISIQIAVIRLESQLYGSDLKTVHNRRERS